MNAVAYLRVSGASQLDGGGFDRQGEVCSDFAGKRNLTIVRSFEEQAVSGTSDIDVRPSFQEMIAYCLDTETKIILIERVDRLHRAYRFQEEMIMYIAGKGLTLLNASTEEDITAAMMGDPMKVAIIQMQGVFAQLDKSMIVAKLRKGRQRVKAINGRCEGQKPFGHYEGEGLILASILTQAECGFPSKDIAERLNSGRHPTRSGKPWSGPTIAKILRRERNISRSCARLAPAAQEFTL